MMAIAERRLAPGTVLEARYKGRIYRCEVVSGEGGVRYRLEDGRECASPSAAGSAVMGGKACNGWRFWSLAGEARPARRPGRERRQRNPRGLPAGLAMTDGLDGVRCELCGAVFAHSREAMAHLGEAHPQEA
jgi:hypothetical protein